MSEFGVDDIVKADRVYQALNQLLLETEPGPVHDAINDYMTDAPMESFARFYDILRNISDR